MTTIAWDGATLSADSRSTQGNLICSDNETKLFRVENVPLFQFGNMSWIGFSGTVGDEQALFEWLRTNKSRLDKFPAQFDFNVIAITETQKCFCIYKAPGEEYLSVWQEPVFAVAGSGSDYAKCALLLGRNSHDAVEFAITQDCHSGGEVKTVVPVRQESSKDK